MILLFSNADIWSRLLIFLILGPGIPFLAYFFYTDLLDFDSYMPKTTILIYDRILRIGEKEYNLNEFTTLELYGRFLRSTMRLEIRLRSRKKVEIFTYYGNSYRWLVKATSLIAEHGGLKMQYRMHDKPYGHTIKKKETSDDVEVFKSYANRCEGILVRLLEKYPLYSILILGSFIILLISPLIL